MIDYLDKLLDSPKVKQDFNGKTHTTYYYCKYIFKVVALELKVFFLKKEDCIVSASNGIKTYFCIGSHINRKILWPSLNVETIPFIMEGT